MNDQSISCLLSEAFTDLRNMLKHLRFPQHFSRTALLRISLGLLSLALMCVRVVSSSRRVSLPSPAHGPEDERTTVDPLPALEQVARTN